MQDQTITFVAVSSPSEISAMFRFEKVANTNSGLLDLDYPRDFTRRGD